jgi:hypothetical protein
MTKDMDTYIQILALWVGLEDLLLPFFMKYRETVYPFPKNIHTDITIMECKAGGGFSQRIGCSIYTQLQVILNYTCTLIDSLSNRPPSVKWSASIPHIG